MRKILAVTGSRADYGILRSVLFALCKKKNLKFSLIVTNMHLGTEFGSTIKEIKKDKFPIAGKIRILPKSDSVGSMAKSFGLCVIGMANLLERHKPDILLVNTDRYEMLAAAAAGAMMNIAVAHMHGGEVSGSIDESIRHAITKLAHLHFVSTKDSAQRIIKLGEDPWRVFAVGAAGLDFIYSKKLLDKRVISRKYRLSLNQPVFLTVLHPVTTEFKQASSQMRNLLEALIRLKQQTVLVYPNADSGGRAMIRVLKEYIGKYPFLKAYKSLPHLDYLSLMKVATVMIGNSSSGIIEAPTFKLAVVNIGSRQEGRLRAANVIDVGYSQKEILQGINKALYDTKFRNRLRHCLNLYGDGKAGIRIANILSKVKLNQRLIKKRITY
jgi:UDP-N-acetylglucosamine 2-epimerase (non-hydrolysing)/GDP/UDP-N,N'-diacetylbacillosamine 2-epimerase (hydrolysing)